VVADETVARWADLPASGGTDTTTTEALQQQVAAGSPGSTEAVIAVNRQFARNLRTIETAYGTTRAWPLIGGTATWNDLATTHAPDWLSEISDDT
jgi:hypothetical protein